MSRRKRLIGLDFLEKGLALLEQGVPMTRIHKTLGLDQHWSYQSTVDLFAAELNGKIESTRPPWLLATPLLQEAPQDWTYTGVFPEGEWIQSN